MCEYKISIIMPVYNGENDLDKSINSIINQTMNLEDIEVIFIDDSSTDNSRSIISKYCDVYPNFKLISLSENVGAAYGPRNVGLKHAKGEFIMFLDCDDTYFNNACESMYKTITSSRDIDFAFGRYLRVYPENIKFKGHSPYPDNINEYEDDLTSGFQFNKITRFFWKNFASKIIYTEKKIKEEILVIEDINNYPEVLSILPSIWTKIYRRSFIEKNNLEFPPYISGEDLNFLLNSYYKSEKVVFLNNNLIHNYYMRSGSVTKNITYPMVYDSLNSYYNACKIVTDNNLSKPSILINPFLLNWISLYFKAKLTKGEKKELYKLIKKIDKILNDGFTSKFLILIIKILLKI